MTSDPALVRPIEATLRTPGITLDHVDPAAKDLYELAGRSVRRNRALTQLKAVQCKVGATL